MEVANDRQMKKRRDVVQRDGYFPYWKMESARLPMPPLDKREYKSPIAGVY